MQTIHRRHCTLSHFSLNIYLFCQPSIFNISPSTPKVIHHNTSPPESYASCHTTAATAAKFPHRRIMKQKSHKHHRNHFQSTKTSSPTTPGNLPFTPHPPSSKSSPTEKRLRLSWHNLFFLCFGFSPKLFFCSSSQYRR